MGRLVGLNVSDGGGQPGPRPTGGRGQRRPGEGRSSPPSRGRHHERHHHPANPIAWAPPVPSGAIYIVSPFVPLQESEPDALLPLAPPAPLRRHISVDVLVE